MPETTAPPADGTTGTEGQPTPTQAPTPAAGDTNPATGKTFTQSDLDRIVAERLARAKPDDYDEAKAALEELKGIREGQKTDLEKAQATAAERTAERDSARNELKAAAKITELRLEALRQGADEDIVIALLGTSAAVTVSDGKVIGAKEAVANLLTEKPNVKVGGVRQSAGEFGGQNQTTVAERIAALEQTGKPEDRREAMRLKVMQGMSLPVPNATG